MPETRTGMLKDDFSRLLEKEDYEGLAAYSKGKGIVVRILIGMTYDKADVISWRAIDAIGRITASMEPDKVRTFVQRVLWMMREESGNNAWTGAEILGEVVTRNPGPNEDIAPIVISFHDELIMRAGCLRALARIASVRPDLVDAFRDVPADYLDDPDPSVRGYAVAALASLGPEDNRAHLQRASSDTGEFLYYDAGRLTNTVVGDLARQALNN